MTDELRLRMTADKSDIQDALVRYCRGIDRGDAAIMRTAFHEDARLLHGKFEGRAWDFADFVVGAMKDFIASAHMLSNILIDVRGDEANAESHVYVIHHEKDHEDHLVGRYLDRFQRRDGEWRIATRQTLIVWTHRRPIATETLAPLASFAKSLRTAKDPLFTAPHLAWS